MIETTAPAKIILLGEHSVVYGQPAIAVPVFGLRAKATIKQASPGAGLHIVAEDLGRTIPVDTNSDLVNDALSVPARLVLSQLNQPPPDIDIIVRSEIPVASGLGSGAAISTVIIRALAEVLNITLTRNELNELVYKVEQLHHGTPSGVDNTVIVHERPVYFIRDQSIEFLETQGEYLFLIADTGIAAPTRIAVGDVSQLYQSQTSRYNNIFQAIGKLVNQARFMLETANYVELGSLMIQNHIHLQRLTVSCPELDNLVAAALDAGAMGAKLSGGGRGGNMIALVSTNSCLEVIDALRKAGAVRIFESVLR